MNLKITSLLVFLVILTFNSSKAQESVASKHEVSLVFGLNQPIILRGFNVEANYWIKNVVIDYSHGFDLHVDGKALGTDFESQKINFKITHSLGLGVGYRFTKSFNLRFEPKLHIYETYYDGQEQSKSNSLVNFQTVTLGVGAYYRWLPFKNKDNALRGLTIVPSIRWWQKVGSSLKDDKFDYKNTQTNRNETFKAPEVGFNNTPLILNISVGYTFGNK